jgi:hypothetical protein
MAGAHLECVPLDTKERDAVAECTLSLDAAPFQADSDSAVDLSGLDGVLQNFAEKFTAGEKVCFLKPGLNLWYTS